jgi:para-nitrobenzyl esterase
MREMRDWGVPEDRVAGLHRHYSADGARDPGTVKERMLTDWVYRLPAVRLAQRHSKAGGSAYLALVPRGEGMPAGHACDVNAIFGVPGRAETIGERARRISITNAVVAFATSGKPGWPSATAANLHAFSFGNESFDATSDYSQLLELWDGITRP